MGDPMRERMGFGKNEAGASPSGRSSVPGIRGSCSAPPLPGDRLSGHRVADEGIELDALVGGVEYHMRRILERSVRGEPSRAASCEPMDDRGFSPSPPHGSPPCSVCPSPSPWTNTE